MQQRPRAAFSLIEAAIIFGVVGIVIGGIWIAASSVRERMLWRQTEDGWLYYMNVIMTNFPLRVAASIPDDAYDVNAYDIDRRFLINVPISPAWKVEYLSCCGWELIDPMGNPFFAQIGWRYRVTVGLPASPDDGALCQKYGLMIATKIDRLYEREGGGPPAGCGPSNMAACCAGTSVTGANNVASVTYELR